MAAATATAVVGGGGMYSSFYKTDGEIPVPLGQNMNIINSQPQVTRRADLLFGTVRTGRSCHPGEQKSCH